MEFPNFLCFDVIYLMTKDPAAPLPGNVVTFRMLADETRWLEEAFDKNRKILSRFLFFRLGSRDEVEDVIQEAFLRLWRHRNTLCRTKLDALILVTARNIATDHLRQRMRATRDLSHYNMEAEANAVDPLTPERQVLGRETLRLLHNVIEELPVKCRTAFVAYKLEGISYADIAQRMGLTESMIRKYVIRAVAHCTVRLRELEEWE